MLMITQSDGGNRVRTLKLEGKLLEPWLTELQSACGGSQSAPHGVCLDLCHLTYVDAAGARFLASLIRDGATVIACSGFVAAMLRLKER